jgi:hypothetical protein
LLCFLVFDSSLSAEQLQKEADLSGIEVVDEETPFIAKVETEIVNKATYMLQQGMETQNQAEVANALQV